MTMLFRAMAAVGIVGTVGCLIMASVPASGEAASKPTVMRVKENVRYWIDPDTGCQYLFWNGLFQPRIARSGGGSEVIRGCRVGTSQ
jgi:hypothetical protein